MEAEAAKEVGGGEEKTLARIPRLLAIALATVMIAMMGFLTSCGAAEEPAEEPAAEEQEPAAGEEEPVGEEQEPVDEEDQ